MSEDLKRPFPLSITYGALEGKHDDYDAEYWHRLRALYEGGKALLESKVFEKLFPRHAEEQWSIYAERKKRAFYINYSAEIVDHIAAALMIHPVQVDSEEPHDEFYDGFVEDVSPKGGKRTSLHQFTWKQIRESLVTGHTWSLVDLPPTVEPLAEDLSEAAQRESGALDAYALCVPAEAVYDWETAPDGELYWAKLCVEKNERSFDGRSNKITKEYTIYRPDDWARYSYTYDPENPPTSDTEVKLSANGTHSFGRVPLIKFELPLGLWVMNKLESLAKEHLNKRAALAWAEYKSLFQERYEFLDQSDDACLDGIEEDANRAVNQVRGQGYTQVRGSNDRAEYIGPDTSSFSFSLNSINNLRDEMHRVTHQMALSFDNSASALRRSGDSKEQDKKDTVIILNALGQIAREHVYQLFSTVTKGRGDNIQWTVSGLDEFDAVDVSGILHQAVVVKDLDIPSPTFKKAYKFELAKSVLAEKVPVTIMKKVAEELEEAFRNERPETAEQRMLRQMQQAPGALGNQFAQDPLKNRDNKAQERNLNSDQQRRKQQPGS